MLKESQDLTTLINAGVNRGGQWLVRGVDLVIKRGEIVTLIGPNGSGKSTTAKMALGILELSEGSAQRDYRLQIGYVPQKISVDWTLPIQVHRFIGLTGQVSGPQVSQALAATEITHLCDAELRTLSGGEFQRAMLARAIARRPDLLVLDEPVQGLDFNGEIAIYELIQQIRDELNCGVLLISHDLHLVMAATDHVICLNGHVCCSGPPSDVTSSVAYKNLFGTRKISKLAVYQHSHDHTHLPDGRIRHEDGSITNHCHPGDGHHAPRDELVPTKVTDV